MLTVIKGNADALWAACASRFLDDLREADSAPAQPNLFSERRGAVSHSTHLWLTQRSQRDLLLEAAASRGLPGWLAPPFSFLSELPKRFHTAGSPIDLLTRRQLISTLAARHARSAGIAGAQGGGIVRGHMLDAVFSDTLPEGITPDRLEQLLTHAADDEFARRRNDWIVAVYRAYHAELEARGLYDPRAIHAHIARAIDGGALREAIGGASRLHVYGLYSARTRRTLLDALARQSDVDVILYVPAGSTEFDSLGDVEVLAQQSATPPVVQPAPDAARELQWVAARVKELLLAGAEPHTVAVIARTGREDTRTALRHLESAGIPCTARIRRPLPEIPVLSLVLQLFRGAGEGWTYRTLRSVLGSSYTRLSIDLRLLDDIASRARPSTLDAWQHALEQMQDVRTEDEITGVVTLGRSERIERQTDRFRQARAVLERLDGERTERAWVELTRELIKLEDLGLQRLLSRPPFERYDIVRFDQRGFRRFETLLSEWSAVADETEPMSADDWYRLLRRMMEGQELVLSTPAQKGVQVLEAQDAALVPFRHVFVIHMNDGEFPVRASEGGIFSEEERSELIAAGLPLEDRALALRREHALWNAITGAGSVIATYRTTDPRGTPLLPSMLLPAHDRSAELPRSLELQGAPITRDQVRQDAAQRLARAAGVVNTAESAVVRRAVLHAHAEQARGTPDRTAPVAPGMWNGTMRDPLVLDELRTRFGPEHVWSASQLQTYTRCPFLFLIDRVLRLRPLEEAEEATSPLTFGGIAHDILERFYGGCIADLPAAFDDTTRARLDAVIDEVLAEREAGGEWLGIAALWGVTRKGLADVVRGYVEWELDYLRDKSERPWRCEYRLEKDGEPVIVHGTDIHGNAVELRLTGFVDRIDVDRSGKYLVLDYKSSNVPAAKGYGDGVLLQAPLYSEALRQLGLDVAGARYRALKKPGNPQNGAAVKTGDGKYRGALAYAFTVPARVQAGLFEPVQAASAGWASWDPDLSICRTVSVLDEGDRFNG